MIGGGVILMAIGWALDDLHSWAWWGSILTNLGVLNGVIVGMLIDIPSAITTLLYNIIGIAVAITIIVYLLTPGVRNQFFPKKRRVIHSRWGP
jgi:hypothetical protein